MGSEGLECEMRREREGFTHASGVVDFTCTSMSQVLGNRTRSAKGHSAVTPADSKAGPNAELKRTRSPSKVHLRLHKHRRRLHPHLRASGFEVPSTRHIDTYTALLVSLAATEEAARHDVAGAG